MIETEIDSSKGTYNEQIVVKVHGIERLRIPYEDANRLAVMLDSCLQDIAEGHREYGSKLAG